MAGECVMLGHRGYGYWFFAFGAADRQDELAPEWEKMKQGFTLDPSHREGWQARPREVELVHGEKVPYRLAAPRELWTKVGADASDPAAEVLLEGSIDKKDRDARKKAHFRVAVLPAQAGLKAAGDAAVKHVVDCAKALTPTVSVETIKDKAGATSKDLTVNGVTLRRTRLELRADEDTPYRYADVAAASLAGGTLVLVGECPWDKRDYWEQEFTALLNSLQVTGGSPEKAPPPEEKKAPAGAEESPE
jgi:hypothetical protein